MKNYELMVIIKPDIGIDEIEKHLNDIKALITSNKGEVTFEDQWGTRDIAYKIKKYDRGHYTVLNFSAETNLIAELENTLKLSNDVLRHLVTGIPEGYEPMSHKDFEKRDEEAAAEAEKEEDSKTKKPSTKKATTTKPASKSAPKEEVKESAKEEKTADTGSSLEDVDAKLKSIIDNPDLNF